MRTIYLWINAALYLLFAVWMTLDPARTGTSLGYLSFSNAGRSEFLVVYGGLQLGLCAFFTWAALQSEMNRAGLIFAVCLYAPIVLYRVITVARFWPVASTTLITGGLELVLLLGGLALLARN